MRLEKMTRAGARAQTGVKARIPTALTVVLVVALLVALSLRIAQVNARYPNPTVAEHQLGETFVVHGVEFCFTNARVIGYAEMKELLPSYETVLLDEQLNPFEPARLRFLLVDVDVRRVAQEEQSFFSLAWIYAQSYAWRNGFDHLLFEDLNGGETMSSALGNGERAHLVLPYGMSDTQFKDQTDWETVEGRPFDLVMTTYPVENIVHILSD
jgi:hypothetical protein